MGREVSSLEHRIPGIVTIGRPLRDDIELSSVVNALLAERLAQVEVFKGLARIGIISQVES
jgi:hypothetical protein